VNPIQTIRDAFLAEASSAPSLFADLAKVELYIAESYRTRALIELLQNADDAGATNVCIFGEGDQLIVSNDGRSFTASDVEALCRSGASSKQRGAGSIGYRGIGFKSIAGLAKEVVVLSGEHSFQYSKDQTRSALSLWGDVPLIRIPHLLDQGMRAQHRALEQRYVPSGGTVFVMAGLDLRALTQEVEDLSPDVLIFLNSVRQIDIQLGTYCRAIQRDVSQTRGSNTLERIVEGGVSTNWLVRRNDGCECVALLLEGESIVPVPQEHAVIHAFLPTQEFSGAYLKMNGDFSTDPSRKAVDLDATSEASLRACIDILWDMLEEAVADNAHRGIFSILKPAIAASGRVMPKFRNALIERLEVRGLPLSGRVAKATSIDIRLAPTWLNYADYETLCNGFYSSIPALLLADQPNLPDALKWMDARTLTLQEALQCTTANTPSPIACVQLWAKAAKQMRFDLTAETMQWLASLPILPGTKKNICPANYDGEELAAEFVKLMRVANELDDIRYLLKKMGGEPLVAFVGKPKATEAVVRAPNNRSATSDKDGAEGPTILQESARKPVPAIQYWRSAEKNAAAWFTVQPGVLFVRDVSQANLGYDLLVASDDGSQIHVEVKSVKRMGEPFRLTNNEHATAYQEAEGYVLAIVVNAEPFEICLISDPIRRLKLEKRCEQWSWFAENYDAFVDQERPTP